MNTISNWARQHVAAARLLITLSHIYVFFSAIYLTQLLVQVGIFFSFNKAILIAAFGFAVIGITGAYRKKMTTGPAKRLLQKFRFLLMGISCALLLVGFFSTQLIAEYHTVTTVSGAFTTTKKKEKPSYENYDDKQAYYKDLKDYYRTLSKKEMRRELRYQLKDLKSASGAVGTIAIVFIIIILISIALYLTAGLACGLSCNGQDGLALLVLIGGLATTIGLAVLLIRAFRKWERKRKAAEEKPTIKLAETSLTPDLP